MKGKVKVGKKELSWENRKDIWPVERMVAKKVGVTLALSVELKALMQAVKTVVKMV